MSDLPSVEVDKPTALWCRRKKTRPPGVMPLRHGAPQHLVVCSMEEGVWQSPQRSDAPFSKHRQYISFGSLTSVACDALSEKQWYPDFQVD